MITHITISLKYICYLIIYYFSADLKRINFQKKHAPQKAGQKFRDL